GEPIRLIVEVVSTNWQDDYLIKLAEYEKLGVPEYWISDYRGLGGIRFIGSPKAPTIWIYELSKQGETLEYQEGKAFREKAALVSSVFPDLSLTVKQIIDAGQGCH
ncbi:MAG: Uma2 family endonuclease, partial [Cyanobacteria bacterium J06607_10]